MDAMSDRGVTRFATTGQRPDLRASLAAPVLACLALVLGFVLLTLA